MTREVQAVVLGILGVLALRLTWSGSFDAYVKPGLAIPLIVSGVLLIALALWTLLRREPAAVVAAGQEAAAADAEEGPDGHEAQGQGQGHGDGHDHSHGPRIGLLLVLPVLTVLLVAPPPLGSWAAAREVQVAPVDDNPVFGPLPAETPADLLVSDFVLRARFDPERSLESRQVRLVGFAVPDDAGDGWRLARMSLSCCAADARAALVRIDGSPAPPADTWVEAIGIWNGEADPAADPVLVVGSVTEIGVPANSYE